MVGSGLSSLKAKGVMDVLVALLCGLSIPPVSVFPLLLFLLEAQVRCQGKSRDHTIQPLCLGIRTL